MALERGWWDEPVSIIAGREGVKLHVNNTAQARRVLQEEWPIDSGARLEAARKAVHSAKVSALKAREAFREAAEEAGILTRSTPKPVSLDSEGPKMRPRPRRKLKRDM